jgi:hypothetical protein
MLVIEKSRSGEPLFFRYISLVCGDCYIHTPDIRNTIYVFSLVTFWQKQPLR